VTETGRWQYFPVAFAVKTPAAVLLLAALTLAIGFRRLIGRLRRAPFHWFLLGIPPAAYFLASMSSNLNLGIRHLLPVYPFLFILIAAVCARRRWLPLVLLLVAIQIYENARIFPHYLAFFNSISGGPDRGPEYLLDSNIDWGQDLKRLKAYVEQRGAPEVCLAYFGTAPPEYFLDWRPIPFTAEVARSGSPDCLVAVSVSLLRGLYVADDRLDWLRPLVPDARLGYSIHVFDLRRQPAGALTDRTTP
jgi:hypothetical protein